jgi:hypothetical protein
VRREVGSTAWVRVDAFDALPGICAKTGVPTRVRLALPAEYVPAGLRWLALFNVWGFVFAHAARSRRRVVRVPISEPAFRTHRYWQVGCAAAVTVGLVVGALASLAGHSLIELAGFALATAGFVAGVRAHRRTWIGLFVDRDAVEVTVTRCHPAFARAAGALAATAGGEAVRRGRRARSARAG